MEWTPLATTSTCWILFLMTWSTYYLQNDQLLLATLIAALIAVEMHCFTILRHQATPEVRYVTPVELYNLVMCSMRRCLARLCQRGLAITSEYTTGMSVSLSYSLWKVRSLWTRCYELRRSSVMAHTKLSTKILSERYSDL